MQGAGIRIAVGLIVVAVVAAVAGIPGCGSEDVWEGQGGPPRVVVSFPPLYCFVKNVAGDDAGVLTLCSSRGPHDYQYNARDTAKVRHADLFLINGLDLDTFSKRIKNNCGNTDLRMVEVAEAIPVARLRKYDEKHGHEHDHGHHHHGEHDPHVWLGIPEAVLMVEKVRDELKQKDPARATRYDERAKDYIDRLTKLHAEGREALKDKANRSLVTSHDAMHYFGRSLDLKILDSIAPSPGTAAGARKIDELVRVCKDNHVRVIATEPQYPPGDAKVLIQTLKEKGVTDVELVELDPLETASPDDLQDPHWYERKMRRNIDTLAKALR